MSRASNRAPPDAGFTLVEALTALFVFALAGVALVQLETFSLATFTRVERQALGSIVAQNRLTETVAALQRPDLGVSEGQSELGGRTWRWRMRVAATQDPLTRRIDVEVREASADAPAASAHAFISAAGP
jgi:general secretion pathway protein I